VLCITVNDVTTVNDIYYTCENSASVQSHTLCIHH